MTNDKPSGICTLLTGTDQNMKTPNPNPFPDRKLISILLRVLGWGLTVGGPGAYVSAIVRLILHRPQHNVAAPDELAPLVALVAGICLLAFDGLITVAVAIEANTNRMAD